MSEMLKGALGLIAQEKGKHAANAIATVTAANTVPPVDVQGIIIQWVPYVLGLLVSLAILANALQQRKTAKQQEISIQLDIESKRLLIAKEGRRVKDMQEGNS